MLNYYCIDIIRYNKRPNLDVNKKSTNSLASIIDNIAFTRLLTREAIVKRVELPLEIPLQLIFKKNTFNSTCITSTISNHNYTNAIKLLEIET